MQNVREIPITALVVNDQGTVDTQDDTYTQEIVGYRLEVYDDGVDFNDPNAEPIRVVQSDDALVDDDDLELAIQRMNEAPPITLDPIIEQRIRDGQVDGPLIEALAQVPPAVLTELFTTLLGGSFPGNASIEAAIADGDIAAGTLDGMPASVAAGLVAMIDNSVHEEATLGLVLSLLGPASARDPSVVVPTADATQNEAARASAALFALAFTHLDSASINQPEPTPWTNATGFAYMGEEGGNCATFVGVALLYAGFVERRDEMREHFRLVPNSTPPVTGIRGATELRNYLVRQNGYGIGRDDLRFGDVISTPGDEYAHISIVVGFGDPHANPPTFYLSREAALADGVTNVEPFVVDHDSSNDGTAAWPGRGIQPAVDVESGGAPVYAWVTS